MNKNDPEYLKKIAAGYAADGYFLKAMALYKVLLRREPRNLELLLILARLHRESDLKPEAMTYFHEIARHHEKTGDLPRLRETLQTMLELEPENVAVRLKLVECHARAGRAEEAGQELEKIGEYLPHGPRN